MTKETEMQDGREPGPDDVRIEGEETRENIEPPTDPDAADDVTDRPLDVADHADEVAVPGGEMPGANEADPEPGEAPEEEQ